MCGCDEGNTKLYSGDESRERVERERESRKRVRNDGDAGAWEMRIHRPSRRSCRILLFSKKKIHFEIFGVRFHFSFREENY